MTNLLLCSFYISACFFRSLCRLLTAALFLAASFRRERLAALLFCVTTLRGVVQREARETKASFSSLLFCSLVPCVFAPRVRGAIPGAALVNCGRVNGPLCLLPSFLPIPA